MGLHISDYPEFAVSGLTPQGGGRQAFAAGPYGMALLNSTGK